MTTPIYDAEEHVTQLIEALDDKDQLVNALADALAGVLDRFESGVFVRSTEGDSDPAWLIKAMPHLRALAHAQTVLAKARGES